jgi:hypothetical protein
MMRARTAWILAHAVAAMLVASAFGVRDARACGGFFCSRPNPDGSLPIAQAAENVLFVMDTDPATGARRVEAHVQILYTGPAEQFSWIVPVTAVPTVDVGWDVLFDLIEPPTRPSFQLTIQTEGDCAGGGDGVGCSQARYSATGGGGLPPPPVVEVVSHGSVGPFDYVVVRSEDGGTLRTWLTDNGYYVSDDGARIVDDYVAGGFSFVAVKLQVGQDTSAIRPIILRLASAEACLPLKLTAIAATPDLRINVWVLAEARAIPINYLEVAVNLVKVDWLNFGRNYDQLLREAANEVQGNAFAVEYAQRTPEAVTWFTFANPQVRTTLASVTDPVQYLAALANLGVRPVGSVLQVFREHVPLPAALAAQGISEASFYANLSFYWSNNRSLFAPFDGAALTADMEAEVLKPMDDFRTMFGRNAYLTRLATFISPEEMTKDPLFVTSRLLPDVSPLHRAIGRVMCGDEEYGACTAPIRIELEDGRTIAVMGNTCGGAIDRRDFDAMPSAEVAWNRDPDSEGQVVLDNRTDVLQRLAAHNATVPSPGGCGCSLRARPRSLAIITFVAVAFIALAVRRRRARG